MAKRKTPKKHEEGTARVNLRLGPALLDRADQLVPGVGALQQYSHLSSISRAEVLRIALARGIESLEAEVRQQQK